MNDNYVHEDTNIIYITENIPGPAENSLEYEMLLANFNSQMLDNCLCGKMCVKMTCKCLQISYGDNYDRYIFEDKLMHRLNHKSQMLKGYPIIECNSNCPCPSTCGNRIVQNGPMAGLIVKSCDNIQKGLGVYAPHFIHKGAFICEYAGELLTKAQALQRSNDNETQNKMNYVFCLNEHTNEGAIQTFIDPSKFGNIGRYINHSCEPNCCVVPVRCEIAIPKLAIFACTDIQPGDEITFSYSAHSELSVENMENITKRKKCLCNSENCTGFIPSESF